MIKYTEMKKLIVFSLTVFLLISCDVIERPYIPSDNETLVQVDFPALNPNNVYRKILLEEYTGHRCTNCPGGHDRVTELLVTYGDTLIPIGIHAGSLAATNEEYPYNFTTPIGVQLYTDFNVLFVPSAIINRGTSSVFPINQWQNQINNVDRSKKHAAIQMINEFNPSNRVLTANAKVTILENIVDPIQLCFVIIENDIIKPQLNAGIRIPEYNHKHVLRGALNGNYGARLTLDGLVQKDQSYEKAYRLSFVERDWNEDNCYVIAYLINMETNEIIQVEQLKVK